MADTVQVLMERMIPELEDLQEKKLFSADEIHQIVERRREFEYMMRRVPLRVVDGLRYIEYELNVDALRKKRKARLALVKMSLSDTAGAKRVHAIFDRLLYKHRGNVDLWLQYISFCKTEGSTRVLSHVFTRALQSHPRSSELWIEAASFEFSENLSVDSARVLMQRAIRINRKDPKLWLEYFRLELLYIQKLSVRREVLQLDGEDDEAHKPTEDASVLLEELPEETETGTTDGLTTEEIAAATEKQRTRAMVLDGAIPRIIFQNAVKAIPDDMAFRLQFAAIADLFGRRFAANLSQFILDACATDFPTSELVHATKALRPFLTADTVDEAEREAVALFERSMVTLPTVTMKEKFVEWLVDRLASPDKTPYLLAYATKTIKQYVDDHEVVSVKICTTYVEFVARTEGSAAAVRAVHEILAMKRYEACAALWLLLSQLVLHPHSHDDDHEKRATKRRRSTEAKSSTHHHKKQPLEESAGILRDALKHIDVEDADGRLAVWIRLLELLVADAHSTPSAVDAAFQDALKSQRIGSDNWNTLREQHLVWASAARPVDAVRVLYKSYMENGQLLPSTSTQAFLLRCIDFESSLLAAQVQVDRVRVLFEKLIDLFGKRDEDVWIAYVAFFRDHARFADANAVLHRAQRVWKDSPRLLQLAH